MKNYLVKAERNQQLKPEIKVYIQPCNENQELNYLETVKGDAQAIIAHSIKMIHGLKAVLTKGTFSVKIESENLKDCIYVDEENIYDQNFEVICPIADGHLLLA